MTVALTRGPAPSSARRGSRIGSVGPGRGDKSWVSQDSGTVVMGTLVYRVAVVTGGPPGKRQAKRGWSHLPPDQHWARRPGTHEEIRRVSNGRLRSGQ